MESFCFEVSQAEHSGKLMTLDHFCTNPYHPKKNQQDNLKELIFGSAKSLHGKTLILYQGYVKGTYKLPYKNFANIGEAETISQLAC